MSSPGSFRQKCEGLQPLWSLVISPIDYLLDIYWQAALALQARRHSAPRGLTHKVTTHGASISYWALSAALTCCLESKFSSFSFHDPQAHLSFSLQPYGRCGDGIGIGGTSVCDWKERSTLLPASGQDSFCSPANLSLL